MINVLSAFVLLNFFGIGQMSADVMFGLKIVALVMVYGYMHMNLGGGMLSTAIFLIFAYWFVLENNGMLAIMVLVLFFLTIHGFDILWGGDIIKGNMGERMARRQGAMEHAPFRARVPP
jgi:hypothetical protein